MRQTPDARFWAKTQKTETCWLWTGATAQGYGRFYLDGRIVQAHNYAYTTLVGPIPPGMVLDHVKDRGCHNRNCVNPDHLEPVTPKENILRGDGPSARCAEQTHCKHGHEFTPANTYWWKNQRTCRACNARIHACRKTRTADE
jgi:hypothetical protein